MISIHSHNSASLPKEWLIKELREILTIGSGKDYKHLDSGNVPVYGTGGFMTLVNEYLHDGESVGIGRKGTIDKPVFLTGKFWTVDTLFFTHSFKDVVPKYIYYRFLSIDWRRYNEASGVPSLSKTTIEKIKIPLPPKPEQEKIASILSTVDEKIANIEQQISETQTLKKGLAQQLLTKGIGHTKFKQTKIGEIPESWEVKRLAKIAKVSVGIATSATHAYSDTGIPMLRNQNIKEGYIDDSDILYITEEFEKVHYRKRLKSGDILITRTGYPGISAVVTEKYNNTQSFTTLIIRPMREIIQSEYLCSYINSEIGKSFFRSNQAGGAQKNVGSKSAEKLMVVIPPFPEQTHLSSIIKSISDKEILLVEMLYQVKKLKKGLMQQLLTGKLRVKVS